jgi:hypothetical protein
VGLGLGSVATTVGLVVYLLAVARLALDYERNALVVQGGWVGVRVLGVMTAVAGALVILSVMDAREARASDEHHEAHDSSQTVATMGVGRGWPAHLTFWCTVVGSLVLLMTLAYWGVYQLGI